MTLIGIDVGWSEKRPSCGLAVSNGKLPLPDVKRSLNTDGGGIRAACLRLSELVTVLSCWSVERPEQLADAIVVIDGPLGPDGPPGSDRLVDRQCATGVFRGRSQPTPISHPSSIPFIAATYQLLAALGQNVFVWTRGEQPQTGITVIETNPTVALAVLMPRVGVEQIPARGRPLPFGGGLVTAKSDWYWRIGAGRQVARSLATGKAFEEIRNTTDHELCAALTCLALAHQFSDNACDGSKAIAIGDCDGIYLLPADLDQSWEQGFCPLSHGRATFGDHASQLGNAMENSPVQNDPILEGAQSNHPVPDPEQCELANGDCCTLVLADNGGVWEKHNPWLCDLADSVRLALADKADYTIRLRRAAMSGASGQWRISPSARAVARQSNQWRGAGHLSLRHPCAVAVQILD
jgi:hypothetical protein